MWPLTLTLCCVPQPRSSPKSRMLRNHGGVRDELVIILPWNSWFTVRVSYFISGSCVSFRDAKFWKPVWRVMKWRRQDWGLFIYIHFMYGLVDVTHLCLWISPISRAIFKSALNWHSESVGLWAENVDKYRHRQMILSCCVRWRPLNEATQKKLGTQFLSSPFTFVSLFAVSSFRLNLLGVDARAKKSGHGVPIAVFSFRAEADPPLPVRFLPTQDNPS